MAKHEIPPFMKGTTAWSFLGYSYAERPPMDLLAPEALASGNPWIVLASVLEHAKRGDFDHIHHLQAWFHSANEQGPDRACIHLTADAGRETDFPALKTLLEEGPDQLRAYAAEAAALVGQLWFVPSMLEAWKRVASRAHHETVGYAISSLLESPGGPIAEKAGSYNLHPDTIRRLENSRLGEQARRLTADEEEVTEFELRVRDRFSELRNQFSDEALWEGQPFNVQILAERMHALVRDPSAGPIHGYFIQMRHKLEAVTGINCSDCYRQGVLQPLNAAAVLETILESDSLSQYEPGVRYFFGHRISDSSRE